MGFFAAPVEELLLRWLQAAIDRYSAKDSDIFVFLLSTRAGGLGITLTAVSESCPFVVCILLG